MLQTVGGGHVNFYPYKKEGSKKVLAMLNGVGWGAIFHTVA